MNDYLTELANKSELNVMMVCLGNICRSPMAAAVLHNRTADILNPKFLVTSSGTGNWHVGEGPNPKSKAVWESAGYQYQHVAQQFRSEMFNTQDLLLVMDNSNYQNVIQLRESELNRKKVFYLRQFDPTLMSLDPISDSSALEVPDPYYEPISAYHEVLEMVESAVTGLINTLVQGR